MNYAKYFSGSSAAGSKVSHAYLTKEGGTSGSLTGGAPVKEKILGDALESTLKDCGLANCKYYDSINGTPVSYLCLDDTAEAKPGFYIYVDDSYIYFSTGYCQSVADTYIRGAGLSSSSSGVNIRCSLNPFSTSTKMSANEHKFYVRVIGDTARAFIINISPYNTPTFATNYAIAVANVIDKRNERELYSINYGRGSFQYYTPIYKDTGVYFTDATTLNELQYLIQTSQMVDNYIVLTNAFINNYTYLWVKETYIPPSLLTNGMFYEIDDDVYYCCTGALIKCTTEVTPTETE
jgi:hypothetical protein